MKSNTGKTLEDAIQKWIEIAEIKKDKNYKFEIVPQFEYNMYIRTFLTDNPSLSLKDAIQCWKIKREKREKRIYTINDVNFLTK